MYTFQHIYVIFGGQLKIIESVMRYLVFATYSETLSGLSSVRTYHQQDLLVANAQQLLDNSVKSYFVVLTSSRHIVCCIFSWTVNGRSYLYSSG